MIIETELDIICEMLYNFHITHPDDNISSIINKKRCMTFTYLTHIHTRKKKKIAAAIKELKHNSLLKKNPKEAKTDFLIIGGFSLNKQGLLYYLYRAVVPKEIVNEVIRKYFDDPATTGEREHLHERLGRKFIGIGRRAVTDFIKSQQVSQLKKPTMMPDLG